MTPGVSGAGIPRVLWATACLVLGGAGELHGQGPWHAGARVGALVRMEEGAGGVGLDLEATVGRAQTPRVEVAASLGFWWFADRETLLRRPSSDPEPVAAIRTEELGGPYLSLAAARRVPGEHLDLLLRAAVAVGLLRERVRFTGDGPGLPGFREITDREITPTWTIGASLRPRGWDLLGLGPRLDGRIGVLTLAGDDFIPVASVGIVLSRPGS